MLDALASPVVSVRSGAARCLGTLRTTHRLDGSTPQGQAILAALLAAVDDPVFEVHSCALSGLGAFRLPPTLTGPLLALLAEVAGHLGGQRGEVARCHRGVAEGEAGALFGHE